MIVFSCTPRRRRFRHAVSPKIVHRLTRGINLADASPERSVVGSRVPILLIHGLADDNIPFQQSERIRAHDPADIVLWEVPLAGHCGAVNVAGQEFNSRVLGWFRSHEAGYTAIDLPLIPT